MEACSLHPLDLALVDRYVRAIAAGTDDPAVAPLGLPNPGWERETVARARAAYARARGDGSRAEAGANAVSYGLALALAAAEPSFAAEGLSLTSLEARIDRGVGMLVRPPSRLFQEAGLDTAVARAMPVRLDLAGSAMGGAFVPARLVPDLARLLEDRTARFLRRLAEAEFDAVAALGLLIGACDYAASRGLGLYEALDVVVPDAPGGDPPGARVVVADRRRLDPALRKRLEEAARPPKQPGLLSRLLRRGPNAPPTG